jgi:hypothetical protein
MPKTWYWIDVRSDDRFEAPGPYCTNTGKMIRCQSEEQARSIAEADGLECYEIRSLVSF